MLNGTGGSKKKNNCSLNHLYLQNNERQNVMFGGFWPTDLSRNIFITISHIEMANYDNYPQRLSQQVMSRFLEIEAVYNFEYGDETEVALCQILTNILPDKYGVCRGFVIDKDGKRAGDDIIIYDKMNFPLIRQNRSNDFSLKHQVPIEAVYSYIECKNSIENQDVLDKAFDQVKKVKELLLSRESIENPKYEKDGPIYKNKVRDWPRQEPKYLNQPFTMIFTRKWDNTLKTEKYKGINTPDLLVLGENEIATQKVNLGADGIKGALFFDIKHFATLKQESINGNSFGISIIMLLQALNKIELVNIDWISILNYELSPVGSQM